MIKHKTHTIMHDFINNNKKKTVVVQILCIPVFRFQFEMVTILPFCVVKTDLQQFIIMTLYKSSQSCTDIYIASVYSRKETSVDTPMINDITLTMTVL